ncbi:RNA polymerase sigma factor [Ramlibacter albus]|uniref:Sigma-70 family RNA polymerase sigma factor n=1 Tax=Ramlibacter albus TaxID=2079448 RepID=A0A923MB87_9BURK|nr:sigma-70 family RNA polymerase sigma factor [Ramlibacter albus]MBC5767208.1 sigma-70 family RNA polymerase sigma factor [Ramlibacter albus]
MDAAVGPPLTFVLTCPAGAAPALPRAPRMQTPSPDTELAKRLRDEQLAQWLRAAAGGDGRAFESFYEATSRHALAVVRRITGEAYAEDVLADCYFQAWRNAAQFDPARGSALSWLMTLARSRALDRLRQETLRHGGATGAPHYEADAHERCPALGPDELLESVEASTRLHEALRELSANERWVLGLAYFRDLSQTEIASLTGMPLGTVKSLMTRSQQKLRGVLQKGYAHG